MLEQKESSEKKKFFFFVFVRLSLLPFGNKKSMEGFMETKASEGMKSLGIVALGMKRRKRGRGEGTENGKTLLKPSEKSKGSNIFYKDFLLFLPLPHQFRCLVRGFEGKNLKEMIFHCFFSFSSRVALIFA